MTTCGLVDVADMAAGEYGSIDAPSPPLRDGQLRASATIRGALDEKVTGLGKLESAHGVAIERRHAGAGIPAIVPRLEMDDERWQVQIDTNFTGSADDAAPPVTFIASDDAPMIFGATFDVTGGDSARNLA